MGANELAAALQRAETVFRRRPETGLHDDLQATSRWEGGTRVVASHANGTQITSDMPCELGGTGDRITPGWLFRAGLASCSATAIAMTAAAQGIDLASLEVRVGSRSDARGLLGMNGVDGEPVCAGPRDYEVRVGIAAHGASPERLRALVDEGLRRSPMQQALKTAMPIALVVHVATE
ncbi:MAG TPA: OsmC family protein [Burkholderiaceae bacterium]|nr:OsmC family protein [Burkholderiaceae bacterium]